MKKKMMKAIKELNAYIDNDREKLCDELHELKLSHKRMERLLCQCYEFCKISYSELVTPFTEDYNLECKSLMERISRELANPCLRRNWGYTLKQEPGHYCDN